MNTNSRPALRRLAFMGTLAAIDLAIVWSLAMGRLPAGSAVEVAAVAAILGSTGWMGHWLSRRAIRPRRDHDGHERLELLRDRTCLPEVILVAVIGTAWANHGGQAAVTVDVRTGQALSQWFPLACFPPGSLVLNCQGATGLQVLDWMPPAEVEAAHRHHARQDRRQTRSLSVRPWLGSSPRRLHVEVRHALRQAIRATNAHAPDRLGPEIVGNHQANSGTP